MAILGFFKRDKSKPTTSQASLSQIPSPDDAASSESYVLPPSSGLLPSAGNGDDGYASSSPSFVSAASSKKLRLPFTKKSRTPSTSPLTRPLDPQRKSLNVSSDKLSLSISTSFDPPSLQSSAFPSFHVSPSTSTLPRLDTNTRPQATPLQRADNSNEHKSSGGLFGWRERKKSKPTKPDTETLIPPLLSDDSFNLKSFRHVLPESRSGSSQKISSIQSPSSSSLVPPARPRGVSVASTDSSQRISVAAFREAQARRSSTNLASGSPSPTIRPVSLASSTVSEVVPSRPPMPGRPPVSASPPTPAGRATPSRRSIAVSSSSEATSSEESESEDNTPSRSRSRLSRQRTITKRSYGARSDLGHGASRATDFSHHQQTSSARSELGHGSNDRYSHSSGSPSRGPPPSSFLKSGEATDVGTRSFSLYRRQRASYSASELTPSAAAQRAKAVVEANKRERAAAAALRQRGRDSDTSESSSDSDSSDDDAPLSALMYPKRPGSAFSNRSGGSSATARKPLIDLNMKSNPLTGKPITDVSGADEPKGRKTLISPTDINGRLSQLTSAAGLKAHRGNSASRSEANINLPNQQVAQQSGLRPSFRDSPKPDSPASTTTIIAPPRLESLKSGIPAPAARRASASSIPNPLDGAQSTTDDLHPVPVAGRSARDTGFKVVSRPQKSATSPPSFGSFENSADSPSRTPRESHHRQPSSSTFTVTSRPQSSVTPLITAPLTASPQKGSSVSGSSVSGTSSGSYPASTMQKSVPQRPFVMGGKRQESPASSTGGSSNGKAPSTPMDGSDYFNPDIRESGDSARSSSVGATPPSAMKGARRHFKRASVTFQEPLELDKEVTIRGRKSGLGQAKVQPQPSVEERENRLRDRRRSEAKAAIELANVISGRSPLDTEDDNEDSTRVPRLPPKNMGNGIGMDFNMMQMRWQQQGVTPMMGGMAGMGPIGPMGSMPGMGMGMGPGSAQFMFPPPPPGADAAYLAAHQQAMQIAKQAYQYAVAQQAMAAAADEWERGSSVSAFTAPGGGMGMGMGGFSMGGMNNMWNASSMFPPAPRSMYGGGGGGLSDAGWGTESVYGETFGPSTVRRSQMLNGNMRNPGGGAASVVGFPSSYQRAESTGNVPYSTARNVPRPRTKTAPSNVPLPAQHRLSRGPPSSWKAGA